ncbi:MAG: DNA-directed RNA polymerase subunit beta, partial [Planctomycetota bacterium]
MKEIRNYSKFEDAIPVSNLMHLQMEGYEKFLQLNVPPSQRRKDRGIEKILQEIFPIENYNETLRLEYIKYDLSAPRFTPDQCRELKVTYGMPFRIWVRLVREGEPIIEEEVHLGEIPKMIGGGEFIINGAERVIVNQLHRSPGIDFGIETAKHEKPLYKCRIIPERGSWVELVTTKKNEIQVRIDQTTKCEATTFLRALAPEYSTTEAIIREFYQTGEIKVKTEASLGKVVGKISVVDMRDPETEELILGAGEKITEEIAERLFELNFRTFEVITEENPSKYILNTLHKDPTTNHDEAVLRIYSKLRPGSPTSLDRAKQAIKEKFFDGNKYNLGPIGRFRISRKFNEPILEEYPPEDMVLKTSDVLHCFHYLIKLTRNEGELDDIDHLGNRRVKTIEELVGQELRKGFLKLRRTIRERMNLMEPDKISCKNLINAKTISSTIEYFFGRGELSQVVDQTNPLAQLTHERTLSALGPGGLNRKRAGFEVRDVHISHYGRICPIETPEGANIGLISRLAIYAHLDKYGFLTTPYRKVKNKKITDEIVYLRADQEDNAVLASSDVKIEKGKLAEDFVVARAHGEVRKVPASEVEYIDVSPKQLVGVSASLIPFLEHDDANRALMGSNMQRQAVPLIKSEPPIVSTGMEEEVAKNSGMVVVALEDGIVNYVDAKRIIIGDRVYELRKFTGLNDRTCLNQKPIVREGQQVKKGQVIADGAATKDGTLSLGKNVLVAFMPWEGYNFEDAIIVSEKLVREDTYTSIHIDSFEIKIRETKLGKEEFTNEIPNVADRLRRNLDENGIIRVGTRVKPGDILVGKVVPKSKTELTPEEKLLHAIFGKAGADVKNDSLEVPSGVEGIVIETKHFKRTPPVEADKVSEIQNDIIRRYNRKIWEQIQYLFQK